MRPPYTLQTSIIRFRQPLLILTFGAAFFLFIRFYSSFLNLSPPRQDLRFFCALLLISQFHFKSIPNSLMRLWTFALPLIGIGYSLFFWRQYSYLSIPIVQGSTETDQTLYLAMYETIRTGTFNALNYVYGVGYPLMALAVKNLWARDPFFLVNFLSIGAILIAVYRAAEKLSGSTLFSLTLALSFAYSDYTRTTMLVPWTSTPVCAMYCWALYWWLTKERLTKLQMILIGLFAGIIFATRYVDAVLLLPMLAFVGWNLFGHEHTRRSERSAVIASLCSAALLAGLVLYSHYYFFGSPFETPYRYHMRPGNDGASDQDPKVLLMRFGIPMIQQFIGSLFDVSLAYEYDAIRGNAQPVAHLMILLFLTPTGIYLGYRNASPLFRRRYQIALIGLFLFLIIYSLHPGSCPGCLRFGSAHYYKPLVPWIAVGATLFFKHFFLSIKRALSFTAVVCSVLLVLDFAVTFAVPRIYDVTPKTFKAGIPVDLTLTFKNRWNLPVTKGYLRTLDPHAKLLYQDDHIEKSIVGVVTPDAIHPDYAWRMIFPGSEILLQGQSVTLDTFKPTETSIEITP